MKSEDYCFYHKICHFVYLSRYLEKNRLFIPHYSHVNIANTRVHRNKHLFNISINFLEFQPTSLVFLNYLIVYFSKYTLISYSVFQSIYSLTPRNWLSLVNFTSCLIISFVLIPPIRTIQSNKIIAMNSKLSCKY